MQPLGKCSLSEWGTVLPVHHSHYGSVTLLWASRFKTGQMIVFELGSGKVCFDGLCHKVNALQSSNVWVLVTVRLSKQTQPRGSIKIMHASKYYRCTRDTHATANNILHTHILVFSTWSVQVMCLWPSKLNIKVFTDREKLTSSCCFYFLNLSEGFLRRFKWRDRKTAGVRGVIKISKFWKNYTLTWPTTLAKTAINQAFVWV